MAPAGRHENDVLTRTRGDAHQRLIRPAFVPRTNGRRREKMGTAGASNPQVRERIRASPQVAKSASRTLSRWRHGFEPRWDYKRKAPGQGTSPESIASLNRDSNAEYPANIPRRIEPSECAKGRACRGWMHSPTAAACTADPARKVLRSRRARSRPLDRGTRRRHWGLAGYATDLRDRDQRVAQPGHAWADLVGGVPSVLGRSTRGLTASNLRITSRWAWLIPPPEAHR